MKMNFDIKPELQDSCIGCSGYSSNTVTVTREILELLKFLTVRINSSVLHNLICESCLEKIKNACKFKSSLENFNEEATAVETPCGKLLIVCSSCKNIVPKESSTPLLEVPYILNIIKEEILEKLINTCICKSCEMSMSRLHVPLDSLLVYCRNQTNNNVLKNETIEDFVGIKNETILQLKEEVEHSEKEDINCKDLQVQQEEIDLKTECEAGPSSDEISNLNEDGSCSEDKSFKCDICKYQTKYKVFLNRHISNHKSTKPEKFKCRFCEYKIEHKKCLVPENVKKFLECQMCIFTTPYRSVLKRHMSVHNEAELFRCYLCDYNAKSQTLVEEHLITHKPVPQLFRCSVCQYETKQRDYLNQHLLVHENFYGIKKLHCSICKYKTNHAGHLKRHMVTHKNVSETEIFKCSKCNFQTKYKMSLKNHTQCHRNVDEIEIFKCKVCDYQTKHKRLGKQHMSTHTNINDIELFKCDVCPYQTILKRYLKRHMLVHKDIKEIDSFKCDKCKYQTKHHGNIKRHMLNHKDVNEIETFKCQDCEYETKHKGNLKKHSIVHKDVNETELFRCNDCEFVTKHKRVLRAHILSHSKLKKKQGCGLKISQVN